MFLYTRAMIDKILSELSHFSKMFGIGLNLLYVGYLIAAIFIPVGIPLVNGILAALVLGQFIFNLVYDIEDVKKEKQNKKSVGRAVQHAKIALRAISLGIVIYTTAISIRSNNPAVWIMPIITAILWIISVLFRIFVKYFEKRKDLIIDALKMDAAPVYKTANFISTLKGQMPDDDGSVNPENEKMLTELKGAFLQKQAQSKQVKKEQQAKNNLRRHIAYLNFKANQKAQKTQEKLAKKAEKAEKQTTKQNT